MKVHGRGGDPGLGPRLQWRGWRRSWRTLAALMVAAILAGLLVAHAPHPRVTPVSGQPLASSQFRRLTTEAIAARIEPAVVDINAILANGAGEAQGTGMILTAGGLVLTNNHVVAGAAALTVAVQHGGTYLARVVGVDPTVDVALLQVVGAPPLPVMAFGDPAGATLGTGVVAIGNALGLGGPLSLTTGMITGEDRAVTATNDAGGVEHLRDMLQISAALQPGDSGGPVVVRWGAVVGRDTAAATGRRGLVPVGFAIPIGRARAVARQMLRGRGSATVILARHGFLGVEVVNARTLSATQARRLGTQRGAVVVAVIPHTPAAEAALAPRDVLVAVNGQTVANIQQLATDIADHRPGTPLRITWVTPMGQRTSATVLLTSAPMA